MLMSVFTVKCRDYRIFGYATLYCRIIYIRKIKTGDTACSRDVATPVILFTGCQETAFSRPISC